MYGFCSSGCKMLKTSLSWSPFTSSSVTRSGCSVAKGTKIAWRNICWLSARWEDVTRPVVLEVGWDGLFRRGQHNEKPVRGGTIFTGGWKICSLLSASVVDPAPALFICSLLVQVQKWAKIARWWCFMNGAWCWPAEECNTMQHFISLMLKCWTHTCKDEKE